MMPRADFYDGLSFAEMLRKLAEHHSTKSTRHLSKFETTMLFDAADMIEQIEGEQP